MQRARCFRGMQVPGRAESRQYQPPEKAEPGEADAMGLNVIDLPYLCETSPHEQNSNLQRTVAMTCKTFVNHVGVNTTKTLYLQRILTVVPRIQLVRSVTLPLLSRLPAYTIRVLAVGSSCSVQTASLSI